MSHAPAATDAELALTRQVETLQIPAA